jgi:hypothetical protein
VWCLATRLINVEVAKTSLEQINTPINHNKSCVVAFYQLWDIMHIMLDDLFCNN